MNIMEQNTIDEFRRVVPKDRLTHDQSWKWGFWYIRQQQSSKRAPPRDTIRFLHPTNRKLDGGSTTTISKSKDPLNENRLQIGLPPGDSPLCYSAESCNTTPRRRGSNSHPSINFWRCSISFQMGCIFRNNLRLSKRAIEMRRLGTSRLTCFSPRGHPSMTIFRQQRSLCSRKRAYR